MARLPEYDPAKDGNRYRWIIEQAQRVREERQAAHRPLLTPGDRAALAAHDAAIDDETRQRLERLRAKYRPPKG